MQPQAQAAEYVAFIYIVYYESVTYAFGGYGYLYAVKVTCIFTGIYEWLRICIYRCITSGSLGQLYGTASRTDYTVIVTWIIHKGVLQNKCSWTFYSRILAPTVLSIS